MERVNLKKFGIVRDHKYEDLSCYKIEGYEGLEINKTISNGIVYLSASIRTDIPWEDVSELNIYPQCNVLNGVSLEALTDKMIEEAIVGWKEAYAKVKELEANFQWPTYADIWSKLIAERDEAIKVAEELKSMLSVDFFLNVDFKAHSLTSSIYYLKAIIQASNRTDAELGELAKSYLHSARGVNIANGKYTEYDIEYNKNTFLKYFNELQNKQ